MGASLTMEVGTVTTQAPMPTLNFRGHEYEYGYGIPLFFHKRPHLPILIPNPRAPRHYHLSSSCCTPSANSRHGNHVTAQRRMSTVLCNSHQIEAEGGGDAVDDDSDPATSAVRTVIIEILLETGLTEDEAYQIASNCPCYAKMLIDTVTELDEFSLWDSKFKDQKHIFQPQEQQQQSGLGVSLSFSQKLKCVALDKADEGKIAFLESLGLALPSAIHLSGLLSSKTLPVLVSDVKHIKGAFFSAHDDHQLFIVGNQARQMMMHLSIPVDDDIQRTLSFFEKIEARRGGLDMLGSEETSFRLLIQSFPRLLLSPVQPYLQGITEFLQTIGIPEQSVGRVLLLFPPIIFLDNEKAVKPVMQAFHKVGITDKQFGKMVYKYPWITSKSIQKNCKEIFLFLEGIKVPRVSVSRAIRTFPLLFGCASSKFQPMMQRFSELDMKPSELGKIIGTSPQLLLRKPSDFLKVASFLQDFGFDQDATRSILIRCPEIFGANIDKTLMKKTEFLSSMGIAKPYLPRVIKKYPELFVSDIDRALAPRINYLLGTGLSRREVAKMISIFSPILGYSVEEVLRPKLEYLVMTMNKPVKDVVDYPRYFSYSLEKKIKARYMVLSTREIECSLKEMLGKNDEEFAAEFLNMDAMLGTRR